MPFFFIEHVLFAFFLGTVTEFLTSFDGYAVVRLLVGSSLKPESKVSTDVVDGDAVVVLVDGGEVMCVSIILCSALVLRFSGAYIEQVKMVIDNKMQNV